MKNILIILALFVSASISANTYQVATWGNDNNSGLDSANAWATWQKAFNTANAGDSVYFRGGSWYPTTEPILNPAAGHGHNGTYGNEIVFLNYPGETPVLNCKNYTATNSKVAVDIKNVSYVKFQGLTVDSCLQIVTSQWISGFSMYDVGVVWVDRMTVRNIMGYGIWIIGFDTLYFTNNDSYDNSSSNDAQPGNRADGVTLGAGTITPDTANMLIMYGNRSYHNSDDGFEISPSFQVDVHDNWSFLNGYLEYGAGVGFKQAHGYLHDPSQRRLYRNLAAYNKGTAFVDQNLNSPYGPVMEFSNNIAYKCKNGFGSSPGSGFDCDLHYAKVIYRNNLVYACTTNPVFEQGYLAACGAYPSYAMASNNTWIFKPESPYWEYNDTVTATDADFIMLDSVSAVAQLMAARKADGSLPDITFLKLAAGSDFIDAGVDVGLSYNGDAPDIGYSEYGNASSNATNILTFTLSTQVSPATINTTNHTVAIQVAYGTSVTSLTPAITVSAGATISPTSGTARDFTNPLSYTVTAEDGTTTQEWTVTVSIGAAPEEPATPTGTKRVRLRCGSNVVHQGTTKRVKI